MLRFLVLLLAGLLVSAGTASADELGDRVRKLYVPYEQEGGTTPDVSDVLKAIAGKHLRDLIAKDDACEKRTQSVCNLGFDPVVNGQDYKIEKIQVSPADIRGDRASVTARFLNMGGQHENRYDFVQEGGAWKLDDIEALQPKKLRWRLTSVLAPSKGKRKAR